MPLLTNAFVFVVVYYALTKFVFKSRQAEKQALIALVAYIIVAFVMKNLALF